MQKRSKGVLTVEACISFTVFALVMITMFYIIRIVYVNGVIQHTINQAAKEFSSYSYLYAVTGLADINDNATEVFGEGANQFNSDVGSIAEAYSSFVTVGEGVGEAGGALLEGDIKAALEGGSETYDDYNDFKEKFPIAVDTIKGVVSNPVDFLKVLGCVFAQGVSEDAKTFVCGEIVRAMCAEYIASSGGGNVSADTRLKNLQVIGGLSGLDFSFSKFFADNESIDIVVCYELKDITPLKLLPDLNMMNRVKVRAWLGTSAIPSD